MCAHACFEKGDESGMQAVHSTPHIYQGRKVTLIPSTKMYKKRNCSVILASLAGK